MAAKPAKGDALPGLNRSGRSICQVRCLGLEAKKVPWKRMDL